MGILREEMKRLSGTMRQRTAEPELDEEIRFHIDMQTEKNLRLGMSPEEARRAALVRFGGTERMKEEARDEYRSRPLEDLVQDVRYGLRSALRTPLFTLLAVLTLALGIGANAAVFGVVKSVLLDALPYADADRLVRVYGRKVDGSLERSGVSAGLVMDFIRMQRSFTRLATFYQGVEDTAYSSGAEARILKLTLAGAGFFETLGVPPRLGRTLTEADCVTGARVLMLSYAAWQRELGGDPGVIGKSMRLNARPWQVVGVLPRGFVGPMGDADLYLPLDLGPTLRDSTRARRRHWLGVVGRLAPGATAEGAQRDLAAISAQMAREHPESDAGHTAVAVPLRDSMVGDTRAPLILLMASAGLVLLITCANLAAALLSRTLSRRQELAVRVALGARRGRLVRQLLTESVLLAVAGGLVGILLAWLGMAALRTVSLPVLPAYAVLSLDRGAVIVTFLLALLTGAAFGLAPALSAGRTSPQGTLREGTRGASESRRTRRLRGALVAGQIALCVSLLAGAGLLARSLWAMATAPVGLHPDGVLAVNVQLTSHKYDGDGALLRFYDELTERLRSLPGVTAVANVSELPGPAMNRNGLAIEGVAWPPEEGQPFIRYVEVSDDYFRTLGIPLLRGRVFGPVDRPGAPKAIVISESLARKYWPGGPDQAVGSHVRLGPDLESPWSVVVGVVGDVRNDPALVEPEPMSYASMRQETWGNNFLLQTKGDPLALIGPFRHELAALDPEVPIGKAETLRSRLAEGMAGRRLPVLLMTAFGALALLLASVGVYALFSSMVAARERELGLRIVLGSTRQAIAGLVLWGGAAWMATGLAFGAVGVVVVARLVRNLLFGVPPFDPLALGASVMTLLVCATVALLVPVRRATRVDPITAIRE
ncbi:MAG TPA: ABC transporter permease [Thermoanaerobaculia bacterium]|jgi:predicted permease|nr:ABC transporter permease [Thermoanaerobaculia bacterium]